MAIPTTGGQLWPSGGATNPATIIEGVRAFVRGPDLAFLAHSAYRSVLGITGGTSTAVDDSSAILATQVFGA